MQLLVELPAVGLAVSFPLHSTQRIKYTCFDVSENLLIFGATSGGLYLFNRDPCTFIQLIPNKDGSIIKIKISPDEKLVSFATDKGYVCVCDCRKNIESYGESPIFQISKEHQGNEVTYLIWNENSSELYIGDDVGTVSILHVSKSFTMNVFQTLVFSLMKLDSRIIQIDVNFNLLLVSTLTRCFICDIIKEHYAQIGQKLRDGEFGACFFYESEENHMQSNSKDTEQYDANKTNKPFSILATDDKIKYDNVGNIKIFCARPGSRIWEVQIDGTVICTHQYKERLSIPPTNILSGELINHENTDLTSTHDIKSQSLNFPSLYMFKNKFIFTYRKDGFYMFDPNNSTVVLWSDKYNDIIDCKIVNDFIYIWRSNANLTILSYYTIETFLIKCYIDQNYVLCGRMCNIYADTLMKSIPNLTKIHVISDLGKKLSDRGEIQLLNDIAPVLETINKNDNNVCQKSKSGIYMLENSFIVNSENSNTLSETCDDEKTLYQSITSMTDSKLLQISPVIKEFSHTVTDKLSFGLKKTWISLEDKMKKIKLDKSYNGLLDVRNVHDESDDVEINGSIIENYNSLLNGNSVEIKTDTSRINNEDSNEEKGSSEEKDSCEEKDGKSSSDENASCDDNQYSIPNKLPNKARDESILILFKLLKNNDIIEIEEEVLSNLTSISCDINDVFQLILDLESYTISRGYSPEYSMQKCSEIFLQYINNSSCLDKTIDIVINNNNLCSYFIQSYINVNCNRSSVPNCKCGYPLPSTNINQLPIFSEALDIFIEKKWKSSQSEQCYDICKKVPYMWKKILLLRKGEDLKNILILLLQILDEELLYLYLPQFTVEIWEQAIIFFATIKKSECLNCGNNFNNYNVLNLYKKDLLDWNTIGALMIRSVGSINATNIFMKHANAIPRNELTIKFYHSCFFHELFKMYDRNLTTRLIETIYQAYDYKDAVNDMCEYLSDCFKEGLPHSALPLSVASKSTQWGLNITKEFNANSVTDLFTIDTNKNHYEIGMSYAQTLNFIEEICPNKDCLHCCAPLTRKFNMLKGRLWVFSCGHTLHGVCLDVLKIKLCPLCITNE